MGQITKEKVQGWIKSSVKSMLAEEDGAVYFYDIMGGISLMLAWIDGATESENKFCHRKYTIEASVRKTGSSSFAEDWTYIGEGSTLQNSDENNCFATVADCLINIVALYLKPEIYYILPNNEQIELLSEMQKANFYFNDFEEPVADLRQAYQERKNKDELKAIIQCIEAQCLAFAEFLGTQSEEMQSMINIDDLSLGIKEALLKDLN